MPSTSEHGVLPLLPDDRPKSLFTRLLFWGARQRYGEVPTAFRVCYSRAPFMGLVALVFVAIKSRHLRVGPALGLLLPASIAARAGCTFCADLTLAEAIRVGLGEARFRALDDFEGSPDLNPREKAALAYAEAVDRSLHVPDAIFDRLRALFDEREILEIVWLTAMERYFNSIALPLRIGSDGLAESARTRARSAPR